MTAVFAPEPRARAAATCCVSGSRPTASTCSTSHRRRHPRDRRGRDGDARRRPARSSSSAPAGGSSRSSWSATCSSFPGLHGSTLVLYDIDVAAAERTAGCRGELIETRARAGIASSRYRSSRGARGTPTSCSRCSRSAASTPTRSTSRSRASTASTRPWATRSGRAACSAGSGRCRRSARSPRRCSRFAPDALLLNYANPMSVNCWATDLTGVRIVGLCHSVQGTSELLARELGVPLRRGDVRVRGRQPHGVVHDVPPWRRGPAPAHPRGDARAPRRPHRARCCRAATTRTRASSECGPS